jgi:hypothetical protein
MTNINFNTNKIIRILAVELLNNIILCKIWGFNGGDYDDYHLLVDDAVWLL